MDKNAAETSLRDTITRYDQQITNHHRRLADLRAERDDAIRAAGHLGLRQVDLARVTGYTRETIRKIFKAAQNKPTHPDHDESWRP